MRWDGRVLVVLLALALGGLTAWSLRYFGQYQPFANFLNQGSSHLGRIGVQVQGATVVGRERGKPRWRIACRTITFSRDWRDVTVAGIPKGVLYDDAGRPNILIRAGRASYDSPVGLLGQQQAGQGLLRLDGGVRATMPARPGWALGTSGLVWDAASSQARCVGRVSARYPGGGATASDVLVNIKTGDLLLHRLHGTLQIPPGETF
jgi:hypothetical protein